MSKHYIHAVHSVKGGSGKSSFSFRLANELYEQKKICNLNQTDEELRSKKVLLFDADFKGTSLINIFPDKSSKKAESADIYLNTKNKKRFNQLIFDKTFDLEEYVSTCYIKNPLPISISDEKEFSYKDIDICFASEKYTDKKKFLYSKSDKNVQQIRVERFAYWFDILMKHISTVYKNEYKHLIFDLSPSSDEYTESMLKIFQKSDSNEFEFFHYLVVTDDKAHLNATIQYIKDIMSQDLRYEDRRKIVVVINQNYDNDLFAEIYIIHEEEKNKPEEIFNKLVGVKNKIENGLKNVGLSDSKIKEIYYLYSFFNKQYFLLSRQEKINFGKTIIKMDLSSSIENEGLDRIKKIIEENDNE